ncbi:hypothetical protein JAAARDRAFT_58879 [Jaapia argillacea MUCL 33604]|uniref:ABC transporter domain-containing protein n=1 Tax=Jaapia argillacea MUCL 33604 TaxID=933084 RepID=A0A067PP67_9AGAM|nr:hypothetical protein JAAARDRAFT_58879 [Jaapia argillacea MUCL 33604]
MASQAHQPTPHRRPSHATHVQADYFDPTGVDELTRTLSRLSQPISPGQEKAAEAGFTDTKDGGIEEKLDFEKILGSVFRGREDGSNFRSLGVLFENLRVTGLGAQASYQPTFGSTLNPIRFFEAIQGIRHPAVRDILSGFEGVVRPGEMLLVLGRPGAGCSTLLKTLANQHQEYHSVSGEIHYDSFSPRAIYNHHRGDVQYCPEDDVLFPTLTVEETLTFAVRSRAPRTRPSAEGEDGGKISRREYEKSVVEVLLSVFGLGGVRGTLVGDAAIRGISGGEKKRVSIAESLATKSLVNAWDNSTRGLDSSTALEFVRALRIATDLGQVTTIVSIYQAGESLYELFDKVCVIYEGKMAYFGPADKAREYFVEMGYEPAYRQTTADFLVAVTDPNCRSLRLSLNPSTPIPRTSTEFASHFLSSPLGELNRSSMASYRDEFIGKPHLVEAFKEGAYKDRAKFASKKSPYMISIGMQIRAVMVRRLQILKGGWAAQVILIFSFLIQGIIIGTVFFHIEDSTAAYFSRTGVIFFAMLFSVMSTLTEIPALFAQRPIVLRHHRAALYHPAIEALATTLVDVPITFLSILVFSASIYYLVGLQKTAGQYLYVFSFVLTLSMKAWFRALAAMFEGPAPATAIAGLLLLALTLYTGYNIPRPTMTPGLRWISSINPGRYGYEAMLTNEFHTLNGVCATLVPQGPGYEGVSLANQVCTTVGSVPGQSRVSGEKFVELSYGYHHSNTWKDFGILVAFGIGFTLLLLVMTEVRTAQAIQTAVTLFKRGSKSAAKQTEGKGSDDEENVVVDTASSSATDHDPITTEVRKGLQSQPKMTDVFSWQNIEYTVPISGGETRKLLDDVSGYVAPGKLTALMGESGAGKTTLLNVLAQRTNDVGVVRGDRFVNGQPLPSDFQAQTGYCQQLDTHLDKTTVREALLFSAKLRQLPSVPLSEKEAYVERCLVMCGLENHADAIVGSLGVEQRKRTTIGVELAAKPKLLIFLDEPTTGLDSQSAWAIMTFLRSLADNGQAILCTIHQPSSELFHVFDRLLLLRKGGQTVYFGDVGHNSVTMIDYFERNGSRHCASTENPAEFMLDVIGAGATATSNIDWHNIWIHSNEFKALQQSLDQIHYEGRQRPPVEATFHSDFSTSWPYQLTQLVTRDSKAIWRDPTYIMSKLMLNIAGGLFVGFSFYKSKTTLQGTQNKLFTIFISSLMSIPMANQLQVPFINRRDIYQVRERPSRMYSWTALVTSQILAEIPWNILSGTLYFVCWYWTVGFPNDRAGYTYLMFGIIVPLYYTTVGQAVAAMSPSAEIAAILFSFLFSFVLTFNGVFQPYRQLKWWRWMYRLVPYTYLIEGVLGQALGNTQITCSPIEYVTLQPPSPQTCGAYLERYITSMGGYLTNPNATSDCQFCSARTADQFLKGAFNIQWKHHWRDAGLLFGYLAFNIAMTFLLTYLFYMKTWSLSGALRSRKSQKPSS